jgi:hypothetical protein
MFTFKPLFEGMLHCMAFDEIVTSLYSFTDGIDVHAACPFTTTLLVGVVHFALFQATCGRPG